MRTTARHGVYPMKRANIVLDDDVVRQGLELTGLKTRRDLVHHALRELVRRESQKGLLKLKDTIACLVVLCVSGCATSPRTVTRHELESESQRLQPLSSYHRDYLGSDELYHYVRIGISTRGHDCRVLKKELPIRDTYPYVPDKPRVEALLPRLTEATPR